jgi:hypothetical protein
MGGNGAPELKNLQSHDVQSSPGCPDRVIPDLGTGTSLLLTDSSNSQGANVYFNDIIQCFTAS